MATQVTLGSGVVDSAAGLKLRTNGSTEAVDISTGQVVTLAKDAVVNGLTVGKGAGAVSTNTAVGASALGGGSQTGGYNVAVGYQSFVANTTGLYNTGVGYQSFVANTSGQQNTGLGIQAGQANTTGNSNTALGAFALPANTTGSSNTAIGLSALNSNTTASYNTAVGYQAGYTNSTGASNTFIGYQAGYSSVGGGTGAGSGSNSCFGNASGYGLTSGVFNTFAGQSSGYYVTTGSKNTTLGSYNGNQGGLDIRTASNYIVLSDGDGNPRLWHSGSFLACPTVYSVTTASTPNVFVDSFGSIIRGGVSALKYKQDIRDLEEIDINLIRAVRYKSKCEIDDQTKDYFGVIADQVAETGIEELVTRSADGEVEGFQYERLTVVLLKKLQVLEAKLSALENK